MAEAQSAYDVMVSSTEPILTQAEADELIAVEKHSDDNKPVDYPAPGKGASLPLHSVDRRERFHVDLFRGRIALLKVNHNLRARTSVCLVRLDINGAPHSNPDDSKVGRSHLHLYREGYGDAWAYEIDPGIFTDVEDLALTFRQFLRFCNVVTAPNINYSLF